MARPSLLDAGVLSYVVLAVLTIGTSGPMPASRTCQISAASHLQQPGQTHADGTVKAGGLREFIPLMGKIALVSGVDAIFMEVHNKPDEAKCDGPTQWPLIQLKELLEEFSKFIK